MKRYLIGIAGPTASGKTSAAKHLEEAHGAWRTRYSLILTEIAYERGIPHDKQTLQHLSTELRSTLGEDFLTKLMRERVVRSDAPLIVVEGNRRMVDMRFLNSVAQETARDLVLLYIDAAPDIRFVRINERLRGEGSAPLSREAFDALENDECEEELPLVLAHIRERGTVIDNSSITFEELLKKVEGSIR
jgi:dephospho-CoA kinase